MLRRLFALLIPLLALLPLSATAATFKIATVAPDGTPWMEQMRASAAEIARRTEGRVRFRFFPGGIMGTNGAVLRKIRIGQLQGGALTGGGLAEIDNATNIYSLPFAFRSYEEVDYVRERIDPTLITGLKEHGYISFGLSEGGFAYLMSDKPVRTVADLKNRKVWIPEGDVISRTAFEALGVSPIALPLTDVYTALQTGLVDTVASSPIGAIALQWQTRVRYVTDLPLMYLYGSLVIQRRAFERLSAEDQAVVQEVMDKTTRALSAQTRKDNVQARQALKQQGIEFIEPTAQQEERWQERVRSAVENLADKGVFPPALLKTLQADLEEYRRTHP